MAIHVQSLIKSNSFRNSHGLNFAKQNHKFTTYYKVKIYKKHYDKILIIDVLVIIYNYLQENIVALLFKEKSETVLHLKISLNFQMIIASTYQNNRYAYVPK